ncbi:MAG: hypothetical protein HKP23_08065 [Flavobacteriaceae bacterium]|nr:hypothetical protein [Eudoraea sp.]NNJ39182.1 hypothetical protein [Flavobacteriaceae bacterium]
MINKAKPATWFWIVSVLALIWNLLGVLNYLAQAFITEEMKTEYTAEQLTLIEGRPAWVTAAFAIAVWGGLLGCIALLIRKRWARPLLLISLLGIVAQTGYNIFATDAYEIFGSLMGLVIPLIVVIIGILLVLVAKIADSKHWLS